MTVGERIKQRRKEVGMSADKLGEIIGKNRATVFRYENGAIEKLPLDVIKPIAEALLTTPAALMGWTSEENKKAAIESDSSLSKSKKELLALAEQCTEEDAEKLLQMMQILLGKK